MSTALHLPGYACSCGNSHWTLTSSGFLCTGCGGSLSLIKGTIYSAISLKPCAGCGTEINSSFAYCFTCYPSLSQDTTAEPTPTLTDRASQWRKEGRCPECGHSGEWRALALICPQHGKFAG